MPVARRGARPRLQSRLALLSYDGRLASFFAKRNCAQLRAILNRSTPAKIGAPSRILSEELAVTENLAARSQLLTFREAAKLLPGRPHVSTIHRWRLRGIRGVKLQTVRVGGRRYVSAGSLARFIAETTRAADASAESPVDADQNRSSRAADAAERFVDGEIAR